MKVNMKRGRKVRIEMLPLIDIVFLLLVFFIYSMLSMAVHRGITVVLPTSDTAKIDKRLELSVSVKAGGRIFVEKEEVDLSDLFSVLQQRASGSDDPGVLLFGDRDLPYQTLFQVMDEIRKAGISRISMQAEAE
ncbi:MAG: biopolymer transporter ExbD [Desulfobacterales bacterium]|nr:biopolymer transporter ExbD [Desulfobacterales bacterium]